MGTLICREFLHPFTYPWAYPILSYGQNTENALCTQWDLISQPSGYLKLSGSPGTTQLHQFCAVRAPWTPCTPLPVSLAASVAGCHRHHFLSVFVSLCPPLTCHVLGHIWGNFCVSHAGMCLPLSACLFLPVWAPAPLLVALGIISDAMHALHLCCVGAIYTLATTPMMAIYATLVEYPSHTEYPTLF